VSEDQDFDNIAALWQQSSDSEAQAIQGLARRASREGILLEYAEYGLGVLCILAIAVAVMLTPAPAFLLVGGAAILTVAWAARKRHLLGQIERALDTSGREAFIASAIASAEASLTRSTLGTLTLLPAVLLGGLVKYTFSGGTIISYFESLPDRLAGTMQQALPAMLLLALFLYLIRTNFRLRAQLTALRALAREYALESELERIDRGGANILHGFSPSPSGTW
jgi:hypothetical protein